MHFDSPNRPPPLRPLLATATPHPPQVRAAASSRYFVVLNKTTVDTPIGKAGGSQPVVIFASTAAAEANTSARCRAAIAPRLAPRADRRGAPLFCVLRGRDQRLPPAMRAAWRARTGAPGGARPARGLRWTALGRGPVKGVVWRAHGRRRGRPRSGARRRRAPAPRARRPLPDRYRLLIVYYGVVLRAPSFDVDPFSRRASLVTAEMAVTAAVTVR